MMFFTTLIFLLLLGSFNYYVYSIKKEEIKNSTQKHSEQILQMIHTIKQNNTHIYLSRLENIKKFDYFKKIIQDLQNNTFSYQSQAAQKLLFNFENIKSQTNFVESMQIINKQGISYIRAHQLQKFKDSLVDIRPSVKIGIDIPVARSFFEKGTEGFFFRVVSPIFEKDQFLGLLEIGFDPRFLLDKLYRFNAISSALYIKEENNFTLHSHISSEKNFPSILVKQFDTLHPTSLQSDEKSYHIHSFEISDFLGDTNGKILFFQDISDTEKSFENFIYISVITSIILMVVLLVILDRFFNILLHRLDKLFYILNNTKESIIVIDTQTYTIDFANKAAQKNLQYTQKELQKTPIDTLFSIPNAKSQEEFLEGLKSLSIQNDTIEIRVIATTKTEKTFPIQMALNYVEKDNGYIVGICKDLTLSLETDLRLQVNEKIINKYIPLSHTDLSGVITYANDALCKLTGYTKEELLGKSHKKLRSPHTPTSLYQNLWETIQDDKTYSGEIQIVTKTKETIWVRILIEPRYDIYGQKIGYVSTREDVTDREKLRYISEHDQLTGAFNRRSFEYIHIFNQLA